MHELLLQAAAIARSMWRFRWLGVAVAWVVAVVVTAVIFRIPDQYQASARIYVDTQSILKPLMSGLAIQPNVEQQVNMLARTLISRPTLEKLVRMADLDLNATSKTQQDQLIDGLVKDIKINRARGDNLFDLTYANEDQDKAKRVIQSMVSIFVESSLGASRKDSDQAKVFLDEQIRSFEAKLEEHEARMLEFRMRNLDMKTSEGGDAASRLSTLRQQIQEARLQLREAENMRNAVQLQVEQERKKPAAAAPSLLAGGPDLSTITTPELDGRIEALKRNLDALLQRFTDRHPDVVIVRRQITDLEQQRSKEVAERRKTMEQAAKEAAAAGTPDAGNPVLQELNRMLATTEVQISALRGRVNELGNRFEEARLAMRSAPQLEAELAQMTRDYQLTKSNYDTLISRRQQAVMSGQMESAAGMADFRLIEPPRVSPKPVFPNRLLLLPLALVAAVVAGLAVAFLGSQLRPVFLDVNDLRNKTGLPLLGVVSAVMQDGDRRRDRMDRLRFFGAAGSLVAMFGLGIGAMAALNVL